MKKIFILIVSAAFLSGCAAVFTPAQQKITIQTGQEKATVYLDNEEFGTGASIQQKTEKSGLKQVVVRQDNYKDSYSVLKPTHRRASFWLAQVLNLPFDVIFFLPTLVDFIADNPIYYNAVNTVPASRRLVTKTAEDKYLMVSDIRFDINAIKKSIYEFQVPYSKDPYAAFDKLERDKVADELKAAELVAKHRNRSELFIDIKDTSLIDNDDWYGENFYKSLKVTGFIDTVNQVFADNNNKMLLEACVKKIHTFRLKSKIGIYYYYTSRVSLTWYLKNTYGEMLDSVELTTASGEFTLDEKKKKKECYERMFGDVIEASYLDLHNDPRMKKNIRQSGNFEIAEPLLTLTRSSVISSKSEAIEAAVIVKTDKGHGSGFAITNDGYIVTNYHVVAGKIAGKQSSIKIITSQGEEIEGKVVRYNKFRDLALIKVDKKFSKVFKTSGTKNYNIMQIVYTIGTPKSVELGQSISSGVISNERKSNNNNLLQLGMSVNSGNSGGPLFDDAGNLHGVIVAKLVGENTEGVSFAVPGYLLEEYLKISFK